MVEGAAYEWWSTAGPADPRDGRRRGVDNAVGWRCCRHDCNVRAMSALLPYVAGQRAKHHDGSDRDEPGEQAEHDADLAVEPTVGGDGRGKIERGEPVQSEPEDCGHHGWQEQAAPGKLPEEQ